MTQKTILTHTDIAHLAEMVAHEAADHFGYRHVKAYAIPRGGIPSLYAVMAEAPDGLQIVAVSTPEEADFFVDDIIDSGATMKRYCDQFPEKPFLALIDKTDRNSAFKGQWIVFPWESSEEGSAEDIPRRLLQYIGEDPERGGLLETPKRFLKAWKHWGGGYGQDVASLLKVFEDGAEKCDEMVLVKNIPVYSHCEHHLAPFFGVAHVGYVPNGKIVGLSKLSRLVDVYSRRLQVQERLTNQIADALSTHLDPKGVGVVIECRHMCMESRGIQRQGSSTTTSAMRGVLREKPEARAEFMSLIQGK